MKKIGNDDLQKELINIETNWGKEQDKYNLEGVTYANIADYGIYIDDFYFINKLKPEDYIYSISEIKSIIVISNFSLKF